MKSLFTLLLAILVSFSLSFPQVITISEAREDLNGDYVPDRLDDTVTVQGVVYTPNFAWTAGVNHYYVDDGTAGLHIFCPGPRLFNWNLGDETRITGRVAQLNGATEMIVLDSLSWVLISTDNELPAPSPLTIGEYLDDPETYEGSLIQLLSVSMVDGIWPGPGLNSTIQVSDGIDTIDLWLDRDTDINQNPPPEWPGDILAVGAQNTISIPPNDGYQLMPRFYTDFLVTIAADPDVSSAPQDYILNQNYPNPFNPDTKIRYSVPYPSQVTIKVFNVLGSEIAALVSEQKPAGTYEVNWDAAKLPGGVYFYRMNAAPGGGQAGSFTKTKKMILLK